MAAAQGKEKEVVDSLAQTIRQRIVTPAERRFKELNGQVTSLNAALHDRYQEWRSAMEELEKRVTRLEQELSQAEKQIRGLAIALALLLAGASFLFLRGW
ncbi:hypothetical protein [Desulfofundulus thermosubterraneus]|uniref:Tektin family protein n=1 Tax=Desulfofundulus thermosubterraneus DSM 16057 TaxID=1121432 RepID=A0A1M6IHV7_9FIRM|nr:hypothetical protein [Desulfofundulus thermosubterraneus]SHJ34051.1 Tektin family protein [Desulfofundulus thermosubterraneus DSM 16057]